MPDRGDRAERKFRLRQYKRQAKQKAAPPPQPPRTPEPRQYRPPEPPPVRESPDTQDYRRKAQAENVARGASPHGGPGRASRARAERVIRRAESGKASAREVQMLLRREGYDLKADGIYGPRTQAAWVDYRTKQAEGQVANIRRRQQMYLQTAFTRPPRPQLELELFGPEGVKELEDAREQLRNSQRTSLNRLRETRLDRPEVEEPGVSFLGRHLDTVLGAVPVYGSLLESVSKAGGIDAAQEYAPKAMSLAHKQAVRTIFPFLSDDQADSLAALQAKGAVMLAGENLVKAAKGEPYNEQWAMVEAALWGTGPIRGLAAIGRGGKALATGKGVSEAARAAREANRGGQITRAAGKAARRIPLRSFEVGGTKVSREAARSRSGRLVERIADKVRNIEAQAGKELGYSTRFKQNILQVPADVLRKVGRKLNDEQEYAIRILAEGAPVGVRMAHHAKLAQQLPLPELQNYHLAHIGWTKKASRYIHEGPDGVLSLTVDAPRHLHQAWDWFQRAGDLRETLLADLGRLSDSRIMYRLHAPSRVLHGARFKKYEKKIAEEMEADPARQEAFRWIDAQYADDPTQARALKAYYDYFVRSTAENSGLSVPEVMQRIKSVEFRLTLDDLPPDLKTLFQGVALEEAPALPAILPFREIAQQIVKEGHKLPEALRSPAKLAKKLDEVYGVVMQGANFRHWYSLMGEEAVEIAERTGIDPKIVAQLLSIYSVRTDPATAVKYTLQAIKQQKEQGFVERAGGFYTQRDPEVNAVFQGKPFLEGRKGRKRPSYYANALEEFDPESYAALGVDDPVTIDAWMERLLGVDSGRHYDAAQRVFQLIAQQLGWKGKEAQAAAWVAFKAKGMRDAGKWKSDVPLEESIARAGESHRPGIEKHSHLFQRGESRRLEGLPETGRNYGPSREVQDLAAAYMESHGLPYDPPRQYAHVDEERARRIAQAYEEMPHAPDDPAVAASYQAMIRETLDQYIELKSAGYVLEFPEGEYPYRSPWDAMLDLKNNKHLYVFPTEAGFGTENVIRNHPLLADSGERWNGRMVTHNDIFRGVHDVFGHHKEGVGFRADGEENAWRQHAAMYSDLARGAMTSETRGQNSWVNFGPHGEANKTANEVETVYADQKAGLLPEWAQTEGADDFDLDDYVFQKLIEVRDSGNWSGNYLADIHSAAQARGFSPNEVDNSFLRAAERLSQERALGKQVDEIETRGQELPEDFEQPHAIDAEPESAEQFITRVITDLQLADVDEDVVMEMYSLMADGQYRAALEAFEEGAEILGNPKLEKIAQELEAADGGPVRFKMEEPPSLQEQVDIGQTPGIQADTEHNVWDIITKIIDDPAFDAVSMARPLEEIVSLIQGSKFLAARQLIMGALSGHRVPPEFRPVYEELLDNVNQLQRQLAQEAIEKPHVESEIPIVGDQLFSEKTDPSIIGAYKRGQRVSEERGLEDAINAAVKAEDFETAQVLKNMLTKGDRSPLDEPVEVGGERLFQQSKYEIEPDRTYSMHTGMVHGEYVNDADRKLRTVGYRVMRDGKQVMYFRRRREAEAYVERRSKELTQRGGQLEGIDPYGVKGAVTFDEKDFARIILTEASDVTTLPHEISHVMRRLMTPQQEAKVAKAAGARITNKAERSRAFQAGKKMPPPEYEWDEKAEEWFADAVAKVIRTGIAPAGAKREFRALAKAFREVFDEAELPDVPPHVHEAISKMFKYEPKPGGRIFGYEDIEHGVAYAPTWRGMPFKITQPQRAMAEYVRRVSNALFGGGRNRALGAGPDDAALRHSYEGSALMTGFFRKDVIGPKLEKAILANRMAAAGIARKALVDAGSEIPTFADDIAVKVDPSVNTSDELKRFWDKVAEFGDRKLGPEDLDPVTFQLIEEARNLVFPADIDGRPVQEIASELIDTQRPIDNIVWVPKDFVDKTGLLYVPAASRMFQRGLTKWQRRSLAGAGMTWDSINDIVKAQILWLNPAYAPVQFAGNTVMNLMHQGPFAIVSGWKSVLMLRQMELADRLAIDRAMGEGFAASMKARTDVGALLQETLGHWNNIAADLLPRRMAFMHEARRDGLKKIEDVAALARRAREGDEDALAQMEQIARRARRSIVDFDRMSPFERDVMSRWIFFYPWLRGATDYSINFIKDHPAQAIALALMYEHLQAAQEDILGDHPYYANLDVPISTESVGLKVPFTAADVSLSDAVGDKTWRDANGRPMTFKMRQLFTQTTPLELGQSAVAFAKGDREAGLDVASHLTPAPAAAGKAIFGYDPYEGKEIKPGPLTFLNELSPKNAPLTDRIRQIFFTSDEERAETNERAMYPREKRHHVMRVLGGSLAPTPFNTKIGQERARKLKPTLERKTEELQVEAEELGIEPPSKEVLEDLKWRVEYEKRESRDMSQEEKAEIISDLIEKRYGKRFPKPDGEAAAKRFNELLRPRLYPRILAYERDLQKAEDAHVERAG